MEQRTAKQIQEALAKPFAAGDLEWRLQKAYPQEMRGIAVPYVTNRAIQYRLDDVVGVENWYNRFKPWHKFVAKVPGKEDYSHREDPKTGRWRATYATFKRCPDVPGIWEYCGHCFQGETVERGQDPICC